jgi:hypothetical protein
MAERTIEPAGVSVLVGSGLAIVGSLLPWAKLEGAVSASKAGTDTGGVITLVLGIVALLLSLTMMRKPIPSPSSFYVAIVGLAAAGIAAGGLIAGAWSVAAIHDEMNDLVRADTSASWGVGIYMVLAGGIVMVLGGVMGYARRGDAPYRARTVVVQVACPHCAEMIMPTANVCPHCNRDITRVE